MKARLRLIAAVEKGRCLPFDTQNGQKAVLMSKGRDKFQTRCHREHWLPIPEKEPLPFDTQIAPVAVFVSTTRKKMNARDKLD